MNLKLSLLDIGTKSNSIIEALLVSSSIKLSRSESPGQPKSPDDAPPIDSFGPVAKRAFPVDNIIPSLNGKPPLGSKKCAIPLTSPKSFPLLQVIFETSAHKLLIKTSVTNSSTV